jgi:hypothetical protein
MAGDDFVMVQLTPAGILYAKGHPLTVNGNKRSFTFPATPPDALPTPIRVERSYEWNAVLSRQLTNTWQPLCELVPVAASAATVTVKPAPAPGALAPIAAPTFASPAPASPAEPVTAEPSKESK